MSNPENPSEPFADTVYTDTAHPALSPAWINYVAALCGRQPIDTTKPFTYLELGCGFGASVLENAAVFEQGAFYACDHYQAHIGQAAMQKAERGLSNLNLSAASFADLAEQNLPAFDFIVLHGVYSWVNQAARTDIRGLLETKLTPGGLVYLSYNCQPGWASELPLRTLMVKLGQDGSRDAASNARDGVETVRAFRDLQFRYFTNNPALDAALASIEAQPDAYLAHEFFAQAWDCFYVSDLIADMATISLDFVGSATLADNHDALQVNEAQAKSIAALPDVPTRQLALDYATNRRFRRDIFAKDNPPLPQETAIANLRNTQIRLTDGFSKLPTKITVPRGQLGFQPGFMKACEKLFADGPKPLGAAVDALTQISNGDPNTARNLLFLIAGGVLCPAA